MEMKEKKITFFDILSNINGGAKVEHLLNDASACPSEASESENEKAYNSFMINRGLSFFQDSVLFANEMNMRHQLPPRMSYDFYRNSLRPRKRFSKWFKALPDPEDIELIKKRYGYNSEKAKEAYSLFTKDDLIALRKIMDIGGKK